MARVQWLVRGNVREGMRERLLDALVIGSAESAERVREVGVAAGLGRETKGKGELRRRVSLKEVRAVARHAYPGPYGVEPAHSIRDEPERFTGERAGRRMLFPMTGDSQSDRSPPLTGSSPRQSVQICP